MSHPQIQKMTATGAIALTLLGAIPRPALAQSVGSVLTVGTDITGTLTSGNFSLSNILGDLTAIGGVVGVNIPNIGNLTSLGSLGNCSTTGIAGGTIDLGNCTQSDRSAGGFSQKDIQTASQVVQNLQGLYSSASSGSAGGILSSLKGLLGAFGLISPQAASNTISTQGIPSGSSPDSTATTSIDPNTATSGTDVPAIKDAKSPSHAYFLSNVADSEYRSSLSNIAEVTLGAAGQKELASQTQESALALSLSQTAQNSLSDTLQKSVSASQASVKGAGTASDEATNAQKEVNSQDVLKHMAKQNAIAAQQSAINSGQLSLLASNQYQVGTQLVSLQAEEKLHTDQLQRLEVNSAAQLDAATQISNIVDRQLQYNQNKDYQDVLGGAESASIIYVPGLVSATSSPTTTP